MTAVAYEPLPRRTSCVPRADRNRWSSFEQRASLFVRRSRIPIPHAGLKHEFPKTPVTFCRPMLPSWIPPNRTCLEYPLREGYQPRHPHPLRRHPTPRTAPTVSRFWFWLASRVGLKKQPCEKRIGTCGRHLQSTHYFFSKTCTRTSLGYRFRHRASSMVSSVNNSIHVELSASGGAKIDSPLARLARALSSNVRRSSAIPLTPRRPRPANPRKKICRTRI